MPCVISQRTGKLILDYILLVCSVISDIIVLMMCGDHDVRPEPGHGAMVSASVFCLLGSRDRGWITSVPPTSDSITSQSDKSRHYIGQRQENILKLLMKIIISAPWWTLLILHPLMTALGSFSTTAERFLSTCGHLWLPSSSEFSVIIFSPPTIK